MRVPCVMSMHTCCVCVAPRMTASGALPQKTTTFLKDIAKHNDYYIIVRIDLPPALYLTVSRHSLSLNLKLCHYRCALRTAF